MKRLPLLAALKLAAPALGDDEPLPAHAHFCFEDDSFYAYNDIVAVIVGMKTGLNFGLHGQTLLGVLSTSRSEDVEFKQAKGAEGVVVDGKRFTMGGSLTDEGFAKVIAGLPEPVQDAFKESFKGGVKSSPPFSIPNPGKVTNFYGPVSVNAKGSFDETMDEIGDQLR